MNVPSLVAVPTLTLRRFVREIALQDWICLTYLGALFVATLGGSGPRRVAALTYLGLDLALFLGCLVLARTRRLPERGAAVAYRVGIFVAVFGSFAHLHYVLPSARRWLVDAQLVALDRALFGVEPALAFDRYVTPAMTEWFSFFYFSYFFLLAVHVFPSMLFARRVDLLSELSLGLVGLFCVGQLLYLAVPGFGPYQHLASSFEHELEGPTWWRLVRLTVDSGEVSARTDIFPSLHTAAPTYLALFAFRHRARFPFRFSWPVLAFFASQIVVSTMYLRWHYLIDVVAGLLLAAGLAFFVPRAARWERTRREALRVRPVWTSLARPERSGRRSRFAPALGPPNRASEGRRPGGPPF